MSIVTPEFPKIRSEFRLSPESVKTMIRASIVISLLLLSGCCVFPARTAMPIETQVLESKSNVPIAGAKLLRIVSDLHDVGYDHATIEYGMSDEYGVAKLEGEKKWGFYLLAPGGVPTPNHFIAIWKSGYYPFIYAGYGGGISSIKKQAKNPAVLNAINEIPLANYNYIYKNDPHEMFLNGIIKLYPLKQE